MRTLKKTLCLVLALVMVLGVCAVGASAVEFTDADEINYSEAVALLSGIGVINGIEDADGNFAFQPAGTLTRAQAAKIIAKLLKADDTELSTKSTFTDCQGHWADGAIAYVASKGIVAGVGDNKFNPDGKLTGFAFAKMLLCALGYNAETEGMVGDTWAIAVASLAKKTYITYGIAKFDGNAECSREQACQMAMMSLFATSTVEYVGGTTINVNGVSITTGATLTPTGDYLADEFDIDFDSDTDDYGRDLVVVYEDVNGNGHLDSKEQVYAVIPEEKPVLVVTDAMTEGDLYTALGLKADTTINAILASDSTHPHISIAAKKNSTALATKNGGVVEIYYDEYYDSYSGIIISTDAYTVTAGDIIKTDGKQTGTKIDGVATECIYAAGDIVLYEVASGNIYNDRLATTVTAKAASYNLTKETVTVNGTTYNAAFNCNSTWFGSLTEERVFVVDENNNVYFTTTVPGAAAAAQTDFVYVVKYVSTAYTPASTDVLNPAAAKDASVKAEVIYTNGTHAAVALNITGNAIAGFKAAVPAADGSVSEAAVTDNADNIKTWFAYTEVEPGVLVLAELDSDYAAVASADVALSKGVSGTVEGMKTTSATKFVSVDTNYAVTESAGLVDVAMDSTNDAILVTYAKGASVASYVYAVNQAAAPAPVTNTGLAYAVAAGDTVADGVQWTFYEDGKLVTYVVDDTPVAGNVYKLTKNATKDVYTAGTAVVANVDEAHGVKVTLADDTFFTAGSDYYYEANTVICNVAEGHTGEADTVAVGDSVVVYEVSGKLAVVYIVAEAE